MTTGEVAFLGLVLGAVGTFVIVFAYAYVSSWQVRRSKEAAKKLPQPAFVNPAPELRKAA